MLIGKKICLGPMLGGDAPLLFNWFNTLALARRNGPYRPTDQAKFDQWFASLGAHPAQVVFAIRRQGDLRLIGYVQLVDIQPLVRSAELGILIGDAADQGQGFGGEAIALMLDYGWRDLDLQRIGLSVVGDNPRAVHVYRRAGFEVEGVRRRAAFGDGRHQDVTLMAVLRERADRAWIGAAPDFAFPGAGDAQGSLATSAAEGPARLAARGDP
jgi:RimJ/RimL family protein N-acetyltransferase